jgi:Flp pilus assembly protein TadD
MTLAWVALAACGCARAAAVSEPLPAEDTRERLELARQAEAERRYDLAATRYERARDEAPDPQSRAYASREYGRALARWGEDDRAREALEDAVKHAPELADAWHDLGILRHRAGYVEAAELALRRAARLLPDEPRPRVALAALLVNERRFGEARAVYVELLELDISERMREAIAEALALLDDEEAR